MIIPVLYKKLHPEAKIFTYQTEGAACADVYSIEDTIIKAGKTKLIKTGIAVDIMYGYEMIIRGRSGFRVKGYAPNGDGTIDSDYRGEIGVIINNTTKEPLQINKGDRIAQATIKEVIRMQFLEVDELSETNRGIGGFGSTGVK